MIDNANSEDEDLNNVANEDMADKSQVEKVEVDCAKQDQTNLAPPTKPE